MATPLALKARLGNALRASMIPVGRWLSREQRRELTALAAYGGLVHQAYHARPFRPYVCTDVVLEQEWVPLQRLQPTESPARRERDNAVHHYGHDVVLKRAAGLPLVGRPLPFMLEHGVNFSDVSSYEDPLPWVRSYLCMGPKRAERLKTRFDVGSFALGPYIQYARFLLLEQRQQQLRRELGRTLLVIPAHTVVNVDRRWEALDLIARIEAYRQQEPYDTVIWQCFWKDEPPSGLPADWIVACNGHYSNPWFLDCQRTLMELSDAVVACSLGTHVGYALALNRPILFAPMEIEQDVSAASALWQHRYLSEWQERSVLIEAMGLEPKGSALQMLDPDRARRVLDPYFGFGIHCEADRLARILKGEA
jgi:hypothetical protein